MKTSIKSHKDLEIWKRSIELVVNTYRITDEFPDTEKFGLIKQMQRSAVSVPSNIAEGYVRNSTKEYIRFLYISLSSLAELDTQFIIAEKLNYVKKMESVYNEIKSISLMIRAIIKKIDHKDAY